MKPRVTTCYTFVLASLWMGSWSALAQPQIPQDCPDDHICYHRVPGAVCADGTPTGYMITYRKNAPNLVIYLEGGGACWSRKTCQDGNAKTLTERQFYTGDYAGQPKEDLTGWRNLTDPHNPMGTGFNIAFIPYCTGDVFSGDNEINYGTAADPFVVRHRGFRNVGLILKELKNRFPNPSKVILSGTSAGGMGVNWNLGQVVDTFPDAQTFTVNDAGVPFKPPYVDAKTVNDIARLWGAHTTMPVAAVRRADALGKTFTSSLIQHNQTRYPDVLYGFISSYKDVVMAYFARLLQASNWVETVKDVMISVADEEFALSDNYRVFYVEDWWHGYFFKDFHTITSEGVTLADWLKTMLSSPLADHSWDDIRPDLSWTKNAFRQQQGPHVASLEDFMGPDPLRREAERAIQRNFGQALHTLGDPYTLETL